MGLFDKFFSKQKSLVALDIGSSCVKLIELKPVGKTGTEFKLTKAGMETLPPEAIVDGAIMDSGAIVDAINRLFATLKVKSVDVATSVSGNAVIVKKISLPQMSAEELGESIHWEAEQYIPFDIQDVSLDYEILEGAGEGGNMDVLLVAVKKDKIDVSNVKEDELPPAMRKMSPLQRKEYIAETIKKREAIQKKIQKLDTERRKFIEAELKKTTNDGTLDAAVIKSLHDAGAKKGYKFK